MVMQGDSETSLRQENAELNRRLAESEAALRLAQQQLAGFEHDRQRLEEDQRLTNERLTLVARATDDALYDWDLRTGQVWSNDAYRRQFGNHALDVNVDMQEWAQGIHPDDRERVQTDLGAAITSTADNWSAEYHFQRAGGGYAYVLDRMHIVRDGNGSAVRMTGAMFDLTERRQAEEALRASQDKFAKAFHLSPMMLTITSLADGRLLDVNQSLLDTTGYTRDEVLGRTPVEIGWWVRPEERERHMPVLRAQGKLQSQEAVFRMRKGDKRTCLYSVEIIEINGQPCVLTALVDITERKQIEEALRENQHMLSLIMRGGRIGSWWRNPVTNEVWWSRELEELFGLEPGGFGGTEDGFYEFVHPDDRPAIARAVENAIIEHTDYVIEFRFQRADGSSGWMEGRGRATYAPDGQILRLYGIGIDITERKQAEDALRDSTRRLRAIYDGTHEYIGLLTPDGTLLEANRASLDFAGSSREDVIGRPFWDTVWFKHTPGAPELIRQAIANAAKEFVRFQMPIITPAGETMYFDLSFYPIRNEAGDVILIVPEGRDITDLKTTEEKLRESESQQSFLLQLGDALRPLADSVAIQAKAVRVLGEYLGASRVQYGEVEADGMHVLVSQDYTDGVISLSGKFRLDDFGPTVIAQLRAGQTLIVPDITRVPDLSEAEQAAYASLGIAAQLGVPLVKGGRLAAILAIHQNQPRDWAIEDVVLAEEAAERTWAFIERARAEAALQALNATLEARVIERTAELRDSQTQLRKLSAYAERMREDERTRIAREVHDELGGSLTALKMTLARISKGRENDADLLTRMGDIRNQIDELVQTVRRVASDLRPPLLDDFGLVAALKWQAQEWQRRTGIACELDLPAGEVQLDRARRTAVFRVFQESLTNVARHAQATQVMTIVREDAGQLVLTVRDNGRGIDEDALRPGKSLGLLGIRERMRDVAGDVDISGTPGLGTTVIVRVPLDGQDGIH